MAEIKSLSEQLSSYNLLTNLLPGTLFVAATKHLQIPSPELKDAFTSVFVFYFLGLTINRLGSLLLEPWVRLLMSKRLRPYSEYISASKNDPKIEVLVETLNTYRSICALMLCVALFWAFSAIENRLSIDARLAKAAVWLVIFAAFVASYLKQQIYVSRRVEISR